MASVTQPRSLRKYFPHPALIVFPTLASLGLIGFLLVKTTPLPITFVTLATLAVLTLKMVTVLGAVPTCGNVLSENSVDEDRRWRQEIPWGPAHAAAILFLAALLTTGTLLFPPVLAGIAIAVGLLQGPQASILRMQLKSVLANYATIVTVMLGFLLGLTIWFVQRRCPNGYPFGWFNRSRIYDDIRQGCRAFITAFLLSVLVGIACRVGMIFLSHLLPLDFHSMDIATQHFRKIDQTQSRPWFFVATTLLLAPITEEVFFRGLLYRGLRKNWTTGVSAVTVALLFATIHFRTYMFLSSFVMGIVACKIYEERKSLVAPIALHATWNLVTVGFWLLIA